MVSSAETLINKFHFAWISKETLVQLRRLCKQNVHSSANAIGFHCYAIGFVDTNEKHKIQELNLVATVNL